MKHTPEQLKTAIYTALAYNMPDLSIRIAKSIADESVANVLEMEPAGEIVRHVCIDDFRPDPVNPFPLTCDEIEIIDRRNLNDGNNANFHKTATVHDPIDDDDGFAGKEPDPVASPDVYVDESAMMPDHDDQGDEPDDDGESDMTDIDRETLGTAIALKSAGVDVTVKSLSEALDADVDNASIYQRLAQLKRKGYIRKLKRGPRQVVYIPIKDALENDLDF